jgi:hypothetical protein
MHHGEGELAEIYLESTGAGGRIDCAPELAPAPGQYLLGQDSTAMGTLPDPPLPVPVFAAGSAPRGFLAAAPLPQRWIPGTKLHLRGPLGRGFSVPAGARRVALFALDSGPSRLLSLIPLALKQGAAVVLLTDRTVNNLPEEVEVQPLAALEDVLTWSDYRAVDAQRESLAGLDEGIKSALRNHASLHAEILVRTPAPCGGLAECGVCAVTVKGTWKMACKDGPVFNISDLFN